MQNMKNKIIFVIVFIIIASAGIASMIFLVQKGGSIASPLEPSSEPEIKSEEKAETPAAQTEKETSQRTMVDTDYFSLTLLPGWEMTSEENTLPIMAVDSKEQVLNEKAKEIDFRTNLSVNQTGLGENSLKDYVETVKNSLLKNIPIIEITKEEQSLMSGKEAYFLEIESIQDDLKFNTFVALIAGKENTVWAFSFNTLEESWQKYKDIFYKIIEGLKMK